MLEHIEEMRSSETTVYDSSSRKLQSQGCVRTTDLTSPFKADTVAIGTMFTIETQNEPIKMETIEISVNPVDTSALHVEIYTRIGDFHGMENDPSQWEIITNTTVVPAREGRGTLIPISDFQQFEMKPGELRSIYITLPTSDLRYTRADDDLQNGVFASDAYLKINVGIGLADYQFSRRIYPSRLFNGIFHYTHATDCSLPRSKAQIVLTFHTLPHHSIKKSEIVEQMDLLLAEILKSIIDADLLELRDAHKIHLESIQTLPSFSASDDACVVEGWESCGSFDVQLVISHLDSISSGRVKYSLLGRAHEITTLLRSRVNWDLVYGGFLPIDTEILIALKGVPSGLALDDMQILYFEQVVKEYLEQQSLGVSNAAVIGARVIYQHGPSFQKESPRQLRPLQRSLQQENDDWIEFAVQVLAEYKPPYTSSSPFKDIIFDSFRYDRDGFIYDLKVGGSRPGSLVQGQRGDFFKGITHISTRDPVELSLTKGTVGLTTQELYTQESAAGTTKTVFVIFCVGAIIFTLVWLWYFYVRKPSREKDDQHFQYTDSSGHKHIIDASILRETGMLAKKTKLDDDTMKEEDESEEEPLLFDDSKKVANENNGKEDEGKLVGQGVQGESRLGVFNSAEEATVSKKDSADSGKTLLDGTTINQNSESSDLKKERRTARVSGTSSLRQVGGSRETRYAGGEKLNKSIGDIEGKDNPFVFENSNHSTSTRIWDNRSRSKGSHREFSTAKSGSGNRSTGFESSVRSTRSSNSVSSKSQSGSIGTADTTSKSGAGSFRSQHSSNSGSSRSRTDTIGTTTSSKVGVMSDSMKSTSDSVVSKSSVSSSSRSRGLSSRRSRSTRKESSGTSISSRSDGGRKKGSKGSVKFDEKSLGNNSRR